MAKKNPIKRSQTGGNNKKKSINDRATSKKKSAARTKGVSTRRKASGRKAGDANWRNPITAKSKAKTSAPSRGTRKTSVKRSKKK